MSMKTSINPKKIKINPFKAASRVTIIIALLLLIYIGIFLLLNSRRTNNQEAGVDKSYVVELNKAELDKILGQ
ncbi:MAG: hypothetical protein CEN88_132 [Candidatus Berkelbacteria bacterium Licking1014_2]|uniref:Uncharacterized protein n=1 Tax=Candidatus Berkelbacteria bacterium Licking1014_2 TaxID=2017146 RepID=A0A554LWH6_9BACT|nr:MAG: hypothetical protein CEN88_132 [Candidatus Berkelbacteria bacterium Licking1014_2]